MRRPTKGRSTQPEQRCNQIARFIAAFVGDNCAMPTTKTIALAFGISQTRVRQLRDQLIESEVLEYSRDGYLRLRGGEFVAPPLP